MGSDGADMRLNGGGGDERATEAPVHGGCAVGWIGSGGADVGRIGGGAGERASVGSRWRTRGGGE
jgi:hypothetical protein